MSKNTPGLMQVHVRARRSPNMYAMNAELDNTYCQHSRAPVFSRGDLCVRAQRVQDEDAPEDELTGADYDSG